MGLRPARTFREVRGQLWTRCSKAMPRKSYIKGAPHPKVRQYDMGVLKPYEIEVTLVAEETVQIRDNAVEAARQICNKYLEKNLSGNYFLKIRKYPHVVMREHTTLGVAGADRISKGMKLAFGRPKGRAVIVRKNEPLFSMLILKKDFNIAKEALKRAMVKLSGKYRISSRELREEEKIKKVKQFKTVEVPTTPAAAAPTEAKKEGPEAAKEAKTEKSGKEEKKK